MSLFNFTKSILVSHIKLENMKKILFSLLLTLSLMSFGQSNGIPQDILNSKLQEWEKERLILCEKFKNSVKPPIFFIKKWTVPDNPPKTFDCYLNNNNTVGCFYNQIEILINQISKYPENFNYEEYVQKLDEGSYKIWGPVNFKFLIDQCGNVYEDSVGTFQGEDNLLFEEVRRIIKLLPPMLPATSSDDFPILTYFRGEIMFDHEKRKVFFNREWLR